MKKIFLLILFVLILFYFYKNYSKFETSVINYDYKLENIDNDSLKSLQQLKTHDTLVVVYSCKKNLKRAELLYDDIKNMKVDIIIIYADPNLLYDFIFVDNKYLIIKTYDTYDYLITKTFFLFSILNKYTTYEGVFKCDDDLILNSKKFEEVLIGKKFDYFGKKVEILLNGKKVYYAGGPSYYISKKSLQIFTYDNISNLFKKYKIKIADPEDVIIAFFIYTYGNINLTDFILYSDFIEEGDVYPFVHDAKRVVILKI